MKRTISFLLTAALITALLCGCTVPEAPSASPAPSVGAAQNTADAAGNSVDLPARFETSLTEYDGCLVVSADALVTAPDGTALPTATVTRHSFTQEDVDKLLEVFLGESTFYSDTTITKQEAQAKLERYKAMLAGDIPIELDGNGTDEEKAGKLQELIDYYGELAETAPDSDEPATPKLRSYGADGEILTGYAEVDGRKRCVRIYNTNASSSAAIYDEEYGDQGYPAAIDADLLTEAMPESTPAPKISEAEARTAGDELIAALGLDEFTCYSAEIVGVQMADSSTDWGYELQYVRTVNGVPIAYTPYAGAGVESDGSSWLYERMVINVTDKGAIYFGWTSPYENVVVETEESELLPFDDIADIFEKMIVVKNSSIAEDNAINGFDVISNFNVTEARLVLMRVRDKGSATEGKIIPAWDFWADTRYEAADAANSDMVYSETQREIVLTVNAVDGTIIDRDLGY